MVFSAYNTLKIPAKEPEKLWCVETSWIEKGHNMEKQTTKISHIKLRLQI